MIRNDDECENLFFNLYPEMHNLTGEQCARILKANSRLKVYNVHFLDMYSTKRFT